jgi:hypothetical protein
MLGEEFAERVCGEIHKLSTGLTLPSRGINLPISSGMSRRKIKKGARAWHAPPVVGNRPSYFLRTDFFFAGFAAFLAAGFFATGFFAADFTDVRSLRDAWAAARRAIGTRYGEQET